MKKIHPLSMIFTLLAVTLMLLTACTTNPVVTPTPGQGTYKEQNLDITGNVVMKQFSTEEEYKSFLEDHSGSSYGYYGGFGMRTLSASFDGAAMVEDSIAVPMAMKNSVVQEAGGAVDYSETNNQVQGVDEADILKTDGKYIYTLSGNTLHIIKAYPGEEAELVYSKTFDNTNAQGLFVQGNHLALFSNTYSNEIFEDIGFRPNSGLTTVTLYDIADKSNPKQVKEFQLEGSYYDARMMGDNMYVILRDYSPQVRPVYPMPLIVEDNEIRTIPVDNMFYFDMPYYNTELVMVHSISMDGEDMDSVAITADNIQSIYMSNDNLYIVSNEYISEYVLQQEITKEIVEPKLSSMDQALIDKIKKTDNDVLSKAEKDQKIMQVYYQYMQGLPQKAQEELSEEVENELAKRLEDIKYFEYSVINKIKIDDGNVEVGEIGKVPGHVVNQFSLDEYDDYLRIATTINARWSRYGKEMTQSNNNVWTIDNNLEVVGSLTDLAEGENIYSTRFMGDRLYMVTFRQVDPFFVIDLSNPKEPAELGALKIPGFSRYLHPYNQNHIIGIGQDATEMGRATGLKISLFDVTDVSDPKEVAKFVTDDKYAQSTALYEHKAFLFDKDKELMVIPAFYYDYTENENGYDGAMVFKITSDDIELRGLIDHSKSSRSWYGGSVERSLYIGDLLYTKSNNLLRINNLDDLKGVKDIDLQATNTHNMPVY